MERLRHLLQWRTHFLWGFLQDSLATGLSWKKSRVKDRKPVLFFFRKLVLRKVALFYGDNIIWKQYFLEIIISLFEMIVQYPILIIMMPFLFRLFSSAYFFLFLLEITCLIWVLLPVSLVICFEVFIRTYNSVHRVLGQDADWSTFLCSVLTIQIGFKCLL